LTVLFRFCSSRYCAPRYLHSFPTRRSSDLDHGEDLRPDTGGRHAGGRRSHPPPVFSPGLRRAEKRLPLRSRHLPGLPGRRGGPPLHLRHLRQGGEFHDPGGGLMANPKTRKLGKKLQNLSRRIEDSAVEGSRKTAEEVKGIMRDLVRVDTGELRDSIDIEPAREGFSVGARDGVEQALADENAHSGIGHQPYGTTAAERGRRIHPDNVKKDVRKVFR